MRILLSTPYDLAVPGGVNQQCLDQFHALRKYGNCETSLVGPCSQPNKKWPDGIQGIGATTALSFNGATSNLSFDLRAWKPVLRWAEAFQPDIIHLHEPFTPMPNIALLFGTSIPKVGTFHTYSENSQGYYWSRPLFHFFKKRLNQMTAVSSLAKQFVSEHFPGDYTIIPNGIFPNASVDSPRSSNSKPVRLLFVGRTHEPRKGFAQLLDCIQLLEAKKKGCFHLDVIGPGHAMWTERSKNLPITFHGQISDTEKSQYYGNADVLCLPSLGGESFGLVALEALNHGLPVVAFNIAGYRELLANNPGAILVDEVSAQGLAQTLLAIEQAPEKLITMKQAALNKAQEYSWPKLIPHLLKTYEKALHQNEAAQ